MNSKQEIKVLITSFWVSVFDRRPIRSTSCQAFSEVELFERDPVSYPVYRIRRKVFRRGKFVAGPHDVLHRHNRELREVRGPNKI